MAFDWEDECEDQVTTVSYADAPLSLPFVTGSRAYGNPKPGSDLDLVIQVDDETFDALAKFGGATSSEGLPRSAHGEDIVAGNPTAKRSISLRFGALNLIVVNNSAAFEAWRDGTDHLKKEQERSGRPVTRDQAKSYLSTLFAIRGAR